MSTDEVKEKLKAYEQAIQAKIGDHIQDEDIPEATQGMMHPSDEDDGEYEPFDPSAMPEADAFDVETFDAYLQAEVLLPKGDKYLTGTVIGRKRDADGNPIGKRNTNPILDTRVYEVQFPDGHVEEFAANMIAESIYSQVDDEGNQYLLLQEIVDHKCDNSVLPRDKMWIKGCNGNMHMQMRT